MYSFWGSRNRDDRKLFQNISEESKKNNKYESFGLTKTEYIANACVFLLSDASRWITGTNLTGDGGYSVGWVNCDKKQKHYNFIDSKKSIIAEMEINNYQSKYVEKIIEKVLKEV